ncbi:MAG: TVP38/TMEM64 family protein [Thermoleophilaceae bacterium]|nr:TVP38/TMEM64 family protein [Thermoleophilaceae bacterium]
MDSNAPPGGEERSAIVDRASTAPLSHRAERRAALRRLAAYAGVLGAVFAAIILTGSLPSAEEARDWGDGLGPFAALAYVPLFVLANFVIAWGILAGAAGLLFGTAVGWPLALAGVTLAALAQMAVARYLVAEQAGRLLPRRVQRLEEFLQRNGAIAVMESRLVPFLPYGLVNHTAGLTRLRFRDMAVGTVVGAAPKVFAYVALGGSITNLSSPEARAAVGLLVLLGLVGLVLVRRQTVRETGTASA